MKLTCTSVLAFLVSCWLGGLAYGQRDSSASVSQFYKGFMAGATLSALPDDLSYNLLFTLQKGKNKLAFGPALARRSAIILDFTPNRDRRFTLSGATLLYQYFPNPKAKRYDLFFQMESSFHRYSATGRTVNPDPFTGSLMDYQAKDNYLLLFGSYGLSIRFLKHFYILHSAALGYMWNRRIVNGSEVNSNRTGLQGNLRIGLAYEFPGKK